MAILVVPREGVAKVLVECGRKGIPYNIVIASGFAEVGAEAEQTELTTIATEYGIRVIGPNAGVDDRADSLRRHLHCFPASARRRPRGRWGWSLKVVPSGCPCYTG